MLGLRQFKDFEDCLYYVKEHDSFNAIVQISLVFGTTTVKNFFAVDRFQSLFIEDGYSTTEIESIFYDESFEFLKIQYRLLPTAHRRYPITCSTQVSKQELLKIKDLNISMAKKMLEAIRNEILNSLVEGDYQQ